MASPSPGPQWATLTEPRSSPSGTRSDDELSLRHPSARPEVTGGKRKARNTETTPSSSPKKPAKAPRLHGISDSNLGTASTSSSSQPVPNRRATFHFDQRHPPSLSQLPTSSNPPSSLSATLLGRRNNTAAATRIVRRTREEKQRQLSITPPPPQRPPIPKLSKPSAAGPSSTSSKPKLNRPVAAPLRRQTEPIEVITILDSDEEDAPTSAPPAKPSASRSTKGKATSSRNSNDALELTDSSDSLPPPGPATFSSPHRPNKTKKIVIPPMFLKASQAVFKATQARKKAAPPEPIRMREVNGVVEIDFSDDEDAGGDDKKSQQLQQQQRQQQLQQPATSSPAPPIASPVRSLSPLRSSPLYAPLPPSSSFSSPIVAKSEDDEPAIDLLRAEDVSYADATADSPNGSSPADDLLPDVPFDDAEPRPPSTAPPSSRSHSPIPPEATDPTNNLPSPISPHIRSSPLPLVEGRLPSPSDLSPTIPNDIPASLSQDLTDLTIKEGAPDEDISPMEDVMEDEASQPQESPSNEVLTTLDTPVGYTAQPRAVTPAPTTSVITTSTPAPHILPPTALMRELRANAAQLASSRVQALRPSSSSPQRSFQPTEVLSNLNPLRSFSSPLRSPPPPLPFRLPARSIPTSEVRSIEGTVAAVQSTHDGEIQPPKAGSIPPSEVGHSPSLQLQPPVSLAPSIPPDVPAEGSPPVVTHPIAEAEEYTRLPINQDPSRLFDDEVTATPLSPQAASAEVVLGPDASAEHPESDFELEYWDPPEEEPALTKRPASPPAAHATEPDETVEEGPTSPPPTETAGLSAPADADDGPKSGLPNESTPRKEEPLQLYVDPYAHIINWYKDNLDRPRSRSLSAYEHLGITDATSPQPPTEVNNTQASVNLAIDRSSPDANSGPEDVSMLEEPYAPCSSSAAPIRTPEDQGLVLSTSKTYGGAPVYTWKDVAKHLANFNPSYKQAKDIPHALQDYINRMDAWHRSLPGMRTVLELAIAESASEDEPDAPPIHIVNEVDDDPCPPWEFHYSNQMWLGEGVPPPDNRELKGCGCYPRCDPKNKNCSCLRRQQEYTSSYTPDFLYDQRGRLKQQNMPIFECNDKCGCDDDCRNRVVQNGRKVEVVIKKTKEKGWGVFAGSKKIPSGTFLGIYAGELLTDGDAEQRGTKYNKWGRTYLFDVDFWFLKEDDPNKKFKVKYVVDAYHAGNFTRFLNHSCDPNARLNATYINDTDIQKPLLTIFACKDIEPDTEICFSYHNEDDEEDASSKDDAVYEPCRCGAANCKGRLFM